MAVRRSYSAYHNMDRLEVRNTLTNGRRLLHIAIFLSGKRFQSKNKPYDLVNEERRAGRPIPEQEVHDKNLRGHHLPVMESGEWNVNLSREERRHSGLYVRLVKSVRLKHVTRENCKLFCNRESRQTNQ